MAKGNEVESLRVLKTGQSPAGDEHQRTCRILQVKSLRTDWQGTLS
jgi:hypothetical protein